MTRMWRRFAFGVSLAVLIPSAVLLRSQAPAQPDWAKVDEELMRHFQALLRIDTSDPPGKERPAAEYLKQVLDKEGIPAQLYALEPEPAQRRRAPERQRPQAAAPHHRPHRRRQRRPGEVEVPALQRHARRRLRLQPRHGRRQGQPRDDADGDAAAQAAERAARSRRDLPLRSGRGGQHAHRHPVHGRPALSRDRRRVLLRRGRRRDPRRRPA